jgi:hypothetical protein
MGIVVRATAARKMRSSVSGRGVSVKTSALPVTLNAHLRRGLWDRISGSNKLSIGNKRNLIWFGQVGPNQTLADIPHVAVEIQQDNLLSLHYLQTSNPLAIIFRMTEK